MINLSIPEVKAFVNYVKTECKANGIKVELRPTKYVKLSGNIKCSGYFDDGEMKLVGYLNGATGSPVTLNKLQKRTAIDWSGNRYKWTIQNDSSNDYIVLTAI